MEIQSDLALAAPVSDALAGASLDGSLPHVHNATWLMRAHNESHRYHHHNFNHSHRHASLHSKTLSDGTMIGAPAPSALPHQSELHQSSPLISYNPKCPILLIAQRRLPVNQGFGARTTFLMWAADVASKIGAVLAVDDKFWSHGYIHGFHYGTDISWAWRLLPFRNASYAMRTLPAGMTRSDGKTYSVDSLLKKWKCNSIYKVQAGTTYSCNLLSRWCYERLPGALDRSLSAVSAAATPALRSMHAKSEQAFNTSTQAMAVWHIRTGDIVLPLRHTAGRLLKKTIDQAFPRRGVRHVVLTYQKAAFLKAFPWFETDLGITEVFDERSLVEVKAFEMMLGAQVVVSTGSSFPHIPTALAEAGRQIHFFMAPKGVHELREEGQGVCCMPGTCHCEAPIEKPLVSPTLNCSATPAIPVKPGVNWTAIHEDNFNYLTRTNTGWTGSFVRKNTIPVTCSGQIFSEYHYKLRELAAGIDSVRGRSDPSIANLAYEGWMR